MNTARPTDVRPPAAPPPRRALDAALRPSRPRAARFGSATRCALPQAHDAQPPHAHTGAGASPRVAVAEQESTAAFALPVVSGATWKRVTVAAPLPTGASAPRRVSVLAQPHTIRSAHRRSATAPRLVTTARAHQRACSDAHLDRRVEFPGFVST
jgi:hypothetical protein